MGFVKAVIVIFIIAVFIGAVFMFIGNPTFLFTSPDALIGGIGILWILLTLLLPLVLAFFFSKNQEIQNKMINNGKGIIWGSLISIAINVILFFTWSLRTEGFMFMINVGLGIISFVYLIIGIILYILGTRSN